MLHLRLNVRTYFHTREQSHRNLTSLKKVYHDPEWRNAEGEIKRSGPLIPINACSVMLITGLCRECGDEQASREEDAARAVSQEGKWSGEEG